MAVLFIRLFIKNNGNKLCIKLYYYTITLCNFNNTRNYRSKVFEKTLEKLPKAPL